MVGRNLFTAGGLDRFDERIGMIGQAVVRRKRSQGGNMRRPFQRTAQSARFARRGATLFCGQVNPRTARPAGTLLTQLVAGRDSLISDGDFYSNPRLESTFCQFLLSRRRSGRAR